jgi:hypothetical protein
MASFRGRPSPYMTRLPVCRSRTFLRLALAATDCITHYGPARRQSQSHETMLRPERVSSRYSEAVRAMTMVVTLHKLAVETDNRQKL